MPKRPNILLITSDQQHFDTLGFANPKIKTPHLDRLAREGTNFTRAYTNNPVCTPTRGTLITGQYASQHGGWTIGVKVPEDNTFIGDLLREEGYDTSLVGKAHFQPLANGPKTDSIERQPLLRDRQFWRNFQQTHCPWYGFEHVETCRNHTDESHAGGHYMLWLEEQGLADWEKYFQKIDPQTGHGLAGTARKHTWDLPEELHYTPWTAERTIAQIERAQQDDKPFFCWASFHDPHPSYLAPEPWASMYDPADMPIGQLAEGELETMCPLLKETQKPRGEADFSEWRDENGHGNHGFNSHIHNPDDLRKDMAVYYGMTSFMDAHIGRILDKLDELGLAEDTLVVFTTDHGHNLGNHGLIAKAFMYEDNVRLPFLVRWPGHVPAGHTSDALQGLVDLVPTFLTAAGTQVPGEMTGVNQLPAWCGEQDRVRDHVLIEHRHQPTKLTIRSYIDQSYKMNLYRGKDWGELFDLQKDPGEVRNVWDDPAYQAVKMKLYHAFMQAEMKREPTRMPRVAGA